MADGEDRATQTIVTTREEAIRLVAGDMPHEEFERLIERDLERAREDRQEATAPAASDRAEDAAAD